MSKYSKLGNDEIINAQDPLSPPRLPENIGENNNQGKNLTPNSALPIVKSKIFEMYKIRKEEKEHK